MPLQVVESLKINGSSEKAKMRNINLSQENAGNGDISEIRKKNVTKLIGVYHAILFIFEKTSALISSFSRFKSPTDLFNPNVAS